MRTRRGWTRWAVILLGMTAGCGSTRLVDTWMDPGARGASLSRIAVIYMSTNDTTRRIAEDAAVAALAKKIEGAQIGSSYHVIDQRAMADQESMRLRLEKAGFDGALIMRPAGVSHRLVSEPGAYYPTFSPYAYYPTFSGYWRWAYPIVYDTGYLREETIVRLDTRLYSLKDDKLLWAGVSKTSDPSSLNKLVYDVARKVAKALAKDDLVASVGSHPGGGMVVSRGQPAY
jgi:hypothetical protein